MTAMTMPFKVRQITELAGLREGDEISFRLTVGENESWIDRIAKTGRAGVAAAKPGAQPDNEPPTKSRHPLMDYKFTNELGQAISLSQFDGQALAITFFFTRCPIPDYCPRLSKNFAEASRKLGAMPDAPTNWHFLSVTFDPEFDTPAVLKSYGERYHYDPKRWSFLTGPADKLARLARESDVTTEREGSLFNHNFRTLVINANGRLQMVLPIGGDFSDAIVSEILKAAMNTNAARLAE
jgi:protein SCO1/2